LRGRGVDRLWWGDNILYMKRRRTIIVGNGMMPLRYIYLTRVKAELEHKFGERCATVLPCFCSCRYITINRCTKLGTGRHTTRHRFATNPMAVWQHEATSTRFETTTTYEWRSHSVDSLPLETMRYWLMIKHQNSAIHTTLLTLGAETFPNSRFCDCRHQFSLAKS
jgi:hypothetical protein